MAGDENASVFFQHVASLSQDRCRPVTFSTSAAYWVYGVQAIMYALGKR